MDQTNPQIAGVLSAIRALLIVAGGWMAANNIGSPTLQSQVMLAAGGVMVIGPAVWGVWTAIMGMRRARAVGVQAGINLVASGNAITTGGASMHMMSPDTTPPKPVTLATADQIVKDFAPTQPIAKA